MIKKISKHIFTRILYIYSGSELLLKIINGSIWVFLLKFFERLFQFVRIIILARLISPTDFGLFGLLLLVLTMLEIFSEPGFNAAIIQKKGDVSPYLNSVWTIQVLRGFLLASLLLIMAPIVASFFGEFRATLLLQVIAIVLIMRGFINIGVLYFRKELQFKREFFFVIGGTIVDFFVSIIMAILLQSVWALVSGMVVGQFFKTLISYFVHPYRPKLIIDFQKLKELYFYGRWVFGSNIFVFLLNNIDDLFLSKMLGTTALGMYQMAYRISNLPATEITHVISYVMFPAYSKLQDHSLRLRKAYTETFKVTTILSFPITALIVLFAQDFTKIFLGEQWIQIVPVMQVLAIWGLLRSLSATTGSLFQASGRPDLATKLQFCRLICLVILIYPLTLHWGILGTAISVVVSGLIIDPFALFVVCKMLGIRINTLVKTIIIPLIAVLGMCMFYFISIEINKYIDFPLLAIQAIGSVIIYLGVIMYHYRKFLINMYNKIRPVFKAGI